MSIRLWDYVILHHALRPKQGDQLEDVSFGHLCECVADEEDIGPLHRISRARDDPIIHTPGRDEEKPC